MISAGVSLNVVCGAESFETSHRTWSARQRAIFVSRYLRDRDLQREIEEGLNVVEPRNRTNAVICYGKGGEISTNRREELEMTTLCLRILQAALVYVNTLMLQAALAEPECARCSPQRTGAA